MAGPSQLTERAIRGVLWTSLATGAQGLLQLAGLVVLARLLVPAEFGLFAAGLVVTGFSTIFSQVGVGPAIVQRPTLEERHLRTGFALSLLFSLAVAATVWAAAPAVAAGFSMPELEAVLRVTCLVFPCQGTATVAEGLAQRTLRFRWLAAVDAASFAAGFVAVAPLLAWQGYGVWALIGAQLAQQALRSALLIRGQPHPRRALLEPRAARELLYFGGGFTLARIGNYLAGQGDKLVLGACLGPQALGLYAHAYQLMTTPANLAGQVLDRVLFPTMARVQDDQARLARAYRSGVAACALAILPASVAIAVLAPEIVHVLLGPAWMGVVPPFRVLALGMLFRTSYKLSDSLTRATGAVYDRALRQAVYALAIVAGTWVGQRWGLDGVGAGVSAAIILNYLLMAQLSLRLAGMGWADFARAHLPAAALAAVTGALALAIAGWLRARGLPPAGVLAAAIPALAAADLLLCWRLSPLFVGRDTGWLLRAVAALVPAPTRLARRQPMP